jgi:hypothetical protein
MDVLLRELRDGPGGFTSSRDTEIATKEVTIGCAPDQTIQLLGRAVGARHAVIRAGAQVSLSCVGRLRITLNGKPVRAARLEVGDTIELGGHRLTLAAPPAGFEVAIELRPNTQIDAADFEGAFRTDIGQTWLGRRSLAWLLMGLTAVGGFVVPFLAVGVSAKGRAAGGSGGGGWLPVQAGASAFWSTGPLAPGHQQLIGDRCADCHQAFFSTVQDGACQGCHTRIGPHVEGAVLSKTRLPTVPSCTSCHREHDESALVNRADRGCVDCHAKGSELFGALEVRAVAGFGGGRHPPFIADAERLRMAKERSALKFSHVQHLDGKQIRRADGGALGCADCHQLAADGEHFQPPTMAKNCIACHELTFDPDAPDRQLPHGKPREVVRTLEDYFVRKLSDPRAAAAARSESNRRRLPGQEEEEEPACKGGTFACAMKLAAAEAAIEFERRGCITCHKVKDTRSAELAARYEVEPIRLTGDYFPAARFPHRSHLVQKSVDGDGACLTCHPAKDPKAREPLLPEEMSCEGCHSDQTTRDHTRLQCVSCHAYHPKV